MRGPKKGMIYHHADEDGEGDVEQGCAYKTDDADDKGVQELAPDEAAKDLVDIPAAHQDVVGHLDGKEAVDELLCVADHLGLADQQVDGHDEAQERIGDDLHRVDHPVEHAADQGVQPAQGVGQVLDVGDQILGGPLVQVGGP